MSRIASTFARLRAQGRKALIPYLMAGFPQPGATLNLLDALVQGGADVIELGIPFSDPMADGPVIQQAGEAALRQGMNLARVLELARAFRARHADTPLVLMGYANPIERYEQRLGAGAFARDAAAAGVDGVLIVDYPPEECADFAATLERHGLELIFLLAPTSSAARMAEVGCLARGYVYYVALKGVTGAAHLDPQAVAGMLPRIRAQVSVPVGVGFGIRDAASACAIGRSADAVVIGTRLLQVIAEQPDPTAAATAARAFLSEIRQALDAQPA